MAAATIRRGCVVILLLLTAGYVATHQGHQQQQHHHQQQQQYQHQQEQEQLQVRQQHEHQQQQHQQQQQNHHQQHHYQQKLQQLPFRQEHQHQKQQQQHHHPHKLQQPQPNNQLNQLNHQHKLQQPQLGQQNLPYHYAQHLQQQDQQHHAQPHQMTQAETVNAARSAGEEERREYAMIEEEGELEHQRERRDVARNRAEGRMRGGEIIWEGQSQLVFSQRPQPQPPSQSQRLRREEDVRIISVEERGGEEREGKQERTGASCAEFGIRMLPEGIGETDEELGGEESEEPAIVELPQLMIGVYRMAAAVTELSTTLKTLVDRTAAAAECPYPYERVVGECFYAHPKKLAWACGRRVCQGMGGDLADPKHLYALQAFLALKYGSGYLWVGATDVGDEGNWTWVSGRPLNPVDWLFDRPDNRNGNEHCLEMVMSNYPGLFNDETCNVAQRFVCQYKEGH